MLLTTQYGITEMPVPKIKWKAEAPPTGPYRSFYKRGWPMAEFSDGHMAARIECEDEYIPQNVREGKYSELTLYVADYRDKGPKAAKWCWVKVTKKFGTLTEAKAAVPRVYEKHPELLPKENTK